MRGAKLEMNHEDSEYWRGTFVVLWEKLQTIFGRPVTDATIQRCISMGDFLNGNGSLDMMDRDPNTKQLLDDPFTVWKDDAKKFPGYRWLSKAYNDIKDNELRQEKYSDLFKSMEEYIVQWLKNVCGENNERKCVMLKILAIYLGQMGFGIGTSQQTQQDYSLPGHAFWVLATVKITKDGNEGKDALRWVAKQIHPNNPFLKDVK
jgi:hypothetical protein